MGQLAVFMSYLLKGGDLQARPVALLPKHQQQNLRPAPSRQPQDAFGEEGDLPRRRLVRQYEASSKQRYEAEHDGNC